MLLCLQALLANISAMYAVYHGPDGLKQIANRVHGLTAVLAAGAEKLGMKVAKEPFFDTVRIDVSASSCQPSVSTCNGQFQWALDTSWLVGVQQPLPHDCALFAPLQADSSDTASGHPAFDELNMGIVDCMRIALLSQVGDAAKLVKSAAEQGMNLRLLDSSSVTISLDETTTLGDVDELLAVLNGGKAAGFSAESLADSVRCWLCLNTQAATLLWPSLCVQAVPMSPRQCSAILL